VPATQAGDMKACLLGGPRAPDGCGDVTDAVIAEGCSGRTELDCGRSRFERGGGQAVMGFDNHMILDDRACTTSDPLPGGYAGARPEWVHGQQGIRWVGLGFSNAPGDFRHNPNTGLWTMLW
jgi:hypothetical protein